MSRPRECAHEERYKDGHCKPCTRKRQREYQTRYRAGKRFQARRQLEAEEAGRRAPLLTIEDLIGAPLPKPPCDLL